MVAELRAVLTGEGLCSASDRADCEAQDGEFLDWSCTVCPKVRTEDLSARAELIVFLHRLKKGGYPFRADDLEMEDWMDLGLAAAVEEQAEPAAIAIAIVAALMGGA